MKIEKPSIQTFRGHKWLIPMFIITMFSFGLQAIPLFVWLFIPIVLIYTRKQSIYRLIPTYFVISIGLSLGYLGTFRVSTTEGPKYPMAGLTFGIAFLENLILIISLIADRFANRQENGVYIRVLMFPCIWTTIWFFFNRYGPFGDYTAFSTSLIHWADFSQISSLGGRALLDFLIAVTGTIMIELPNYPIHKLSIDYVPSENDDRVINSPPVSFAGESDAMIETNKTRSPRFKNLVQNCRKHKLLMHPVSVYFFVMAFVYTFGGIYVNIRRGSFYQVSYPEYIPKTTPVGCVVGASDLFPDLTNNHEYWLNKTAQLAEAGAKLVLWSETTTYAQNETDEGLLLERTKQLAVRYGIYIGVTYTLKEPVEKNKLVVVTKQGNIGLDYNKAHPVPGVETQDAGPNVLQYFDTEEFGRIGGGICFDYNFATFVEQAGSNKVDLMLQPSWTWGPIGTHHQQGNALRAVENGFTLFRCVTQGVSGIYEPTLNGVFNQKVASNNVEQYLFYLPQQRRIETLYGYIGETFAYLNIAGTVILVVLIILNRRRSHRK